MRIKKYLRSLIIVSLGSLWFSQLGYGSTNFVNLPLLPKQHPLVQMGKAILDRLSDAYPAPNAVSPQLLVVEDRSFQARAIHPDRIVLSSEILKTWQSQEDSLAFIIAHEYSHLFQELPDCAHQPTFLQTSQTQANVCSVGQWDLVRQNEFHADRLGMVIMVQAGFRPETLFQDQYNFIEDFYQRANLRLFIHQESPTHSTPAKRESAIREEASHSLEQVEYFRLGVYALSIGRWDLAISAFERFREVFPNFQHPEAINNLGIAYLMKAQETMDIHLPFTPIVSKETPLEQLREFLKKRDRDINLDVSRALELFLSLKEDPRMPQDTLNYNLGLTYFLIQNRQDAALAHIQQAYEICDGNCIKAWRTSKWMECTITQSSFCEVITEAEPTYQIQMPPKNLELFRHVRTLDGLKGQNDVIAYYYPEGILYEQGNQSMWVTDETQGLMFQLRNKLMVAFF